MAVITAAAAIFGVGLLLGGRACRTTGFSAVRSSSSALSAQTFTTTATAHLQLSTDPDMRGRVIALFLAIALGATPLGAPLVGWVADTLARAGRSGSAPPRASARSPSHFATSRSIAA